MEKAKPRKRHESRDLAKTLFISTNMTAAEVAAALQLNPKTVAKWRLEDNWDEERAMRNTSPLALIKAFTEDIQLIRESLVDGSGKRRAPSTKETDQIKKLTKCIAEMRNAVSPQTIMEVLDGYVAWLSTQDLALAQQVAKHNIDYVRMKLRETKSR